MNLNKEEIHEVLEYADKIGYPVVSHFTRENVDSGHYKGLYIIPSAGNENYGSICPHIIEDYTCTDEGVSTVKDFCGVMDLMIEGVRKNIDDNLKTIRKSSDNLQGLLSFQSKLKNK